MPNYIYALHCPIANTVRYIGKTNNPESRLLAHIAAAKRATKDHHTAKWLRKLLRNGLRPTMEILETLQGDEPWEDYERFYIEHGEYFGWKLTNTTPGGEGGGYVRAEDKEEWKLKVRAGFTDEVRDRISRAVRSAMANPEIKAAQSARFKAKWEDPEYRAKMVEISATVNSDLEIMQRRSALSKERMANPEARELVSTKLKAYYATEIGAVNKLKTSRSPEKIASNSIAQARNWEDPEYRNMIMAAKTSPEATQKQEDKAKNQWADPAIRAKMVEAIQVAQRARAERNRRTPEQEIIWREERLAKRREKRRLAKTASDV